MHIIPTVCEVGFHWTLTSITLLVSKPVKINGFISNIKDNTENKINHQTSKLSAGSASNLHVLITPGHYFNIIKEQN